VTEKRERERERRGEREKERESFHDNETLILSFNER